MTKDPRDLPGETFRYSERMRTKRFAREYWKGVTIEEESKIKTMSAAKLGTFGPPEEYEEKHLNRNKYDAQK